MSVFSIKMAVSHLLPACWRYSIALGLKIALPAVMNSGVLTLGRHYAAVRPT